MEVIKQNIIQLNFLEEEVDMIKKIVKYLQNESKKSGFKKVFSADESDLIDEINIKLGV